MSDAAVIAIKVATTGSRRSARSRSSRPAALHASTVEANDGYDHPMGDLGDPTVHARRSFGRTVSSRSSAVRLPMALAAGPGGRPTHRQHRRVQPSTVSRSPRSSSSRPTSTPVPAARDLVISPATPSARRYQARRGRIVFTALRGGMPLLPLFSTAWPRPCIVETSADPPIVSRKADLDKAAGDNAQRLRLRRPECSANSRSTSSDRSTTAGPPPRREDQGDHRRGPLVRANCRDRHRQRAHQPVPAASPKRATTDGVHRPQRLQRSGIGVASTSSRRSSAACRTIAPPLPDGCRPLTAAPGRLPRRAPAPSPTTPCTADHQRLQRGPAEVQQISSIVPGRRALREPRASATTAPRRAYQAFSGWKRSGSTSKAGLSMLYVAQFMRDTATPSSTRGALQPAGDQGDRQVGRPPRKP